MGPSVLFNFVLKYRVALTWISLLTVISVSLWFYNKKAVANLQQGLIVDETDVREKRRAALETWTVEKCNLLIYSCFFVLKNVFPSKQRIKGNH